MRHPGQVLSRLELLERGWDMAYETRSNIVDVYVRYLREKIDRPFGCDSLETVRGVGYRLREPDGVLRAIPIRWRLAAAFAVSMAVLLVALGAFVYLRVEDALRSSVDQALRAQAAESVGRADEGSLLDDDARASGTVVQLVDRDGRVVRSDPASLPTILDPQTLTAARKGTVLTTVSLGAGEQNRWRALAAPRRRTGAGRRPAARTDRGDAPPPVSRPDRRRPGRAAPRDPRRLPARGRRAPAGRVDAAPGERDLRHDHRGAAPGAAQSGRDPRPGGDAERHARAPRGRARARASLRRGREPRAAHAAGAPEGGAGAGPPPPEERGGAARSGRLGGRGDRPAGAARRGPAADRAHGPGRAGAPRRAGRPGRARPLDGSPLRGQGVGRGQAAHGRDPTGRRRWMRIDSASSRRSATSSTTLSGTARARSRSAPGRQATRRRSTSPTRVTAFRRASPGVPSSGSRGATTCAARGGSGLGLAIVQAIAQAHGGTAGIAANGKGADVWISLPTHARRAA